MSHLIVAGVFLCYGVGIVCAIALVVWSAYAKKALWVSYAVLSLVMVIPPDAVAYLGGGSTAILLIGNLILTGCLLGFI